jgi:hypothetical protein
MVNVQCKKSLATAQMGRHFRRHYEIAMRPITKILLLVIVAFVVYLLWPRTANMKGFDPVRVLTR